eukprot:CAMPEP_0179870908 /NCGR_PEP_ID=MMETSP0982-20121206/20538_1 /TAXON_ID=483367 /ORGANISM="non described non described, Strain CCMP 2436" /LENGTH=128 /DNA_ID=CAMNT_0021761533 /DNA_START=96 /DNA_END=481 /DNA_ORIENTATION=+
MAALECTSQDAKVLRMRRSVREKTESSSRIPPLTRKMQAAETASEAADAARKVAEVRLACQNWGLAASSNTNRTPPIGAPNAPATPQAHPIETRSRIAAGVVSAPRRRDRLHREAKPTARLAPSPAPE